MIEVRLARSPGEIADCLRLRWAVFVDEQGVLPSEEVDTRDQTDAMHALAFLDGISCGAGRFVFEAPGSAKIQRMAVLANARGRGVGRKLLSFLEDEARVRGAERFTLDAQVHARPFYEKAGYSAVGEVFEDARIPHIRMDKIAQPAEDKIAQAAERR
jgi:predicted GNAT family N-acyltransferase